MMLPMRRHNIDGVFVLLVFTVFAACVLFVLMAGAGAYKRVTEREGSDGSSLCASYIAAKVRHADAEDAVFVGGFDGVCADSGNTLFLTERVDGQPCVTRIYCSGGYVRELFTADESGFSEEDGDAVLRAESLSFSLDKKSGLLSVRAEGEKGDVSVISLSLRSGEGAAK